MVCVWWAGFVSLALGWGLLAVLFAAVTVSSSWPLILTGSLFFSPHTQLLSDESYVTASHFAGLLLHHPAMETPVPYRQYGHVVLVEPNPVRGAPWVAVPVSDIELLPSYH